MPRVLGFTTSAFDPASRVRFIQFIPHLERLGWDVIHRPNIPDRQWSSGLPGKVPRVLHNRAGRLLMRWNRLRDIDQAKRADLVFVNRDLAGSGLFFEKQLLKRNVRVIFDFDDAIFVGRNEPAVRWMCRNAAWVTPGNEYLAAYARRHSEKVTVIPTVIDTERYLTKRNEGATDAMPRVGWSGSDQSIRQTLFPFLPMLAAIQSTFAFEMVIVTNSRPELPVSNFRWTFIPWSEENEPALASTMDIGIMPLCDDEFQRGKCGLKLLQYMAVGLPTVASPVGVNTDITQERITGFLARDPSEWGEALRALLTSPDLRLQMGAAGRKRCVSAYSVECWIPKISALFHRIAESREPQHMTVQTASC
jgi:glycosyltransferase involved in cell wall biosynthesis